MVDVYHELSTKQKYAKTTQMEWSNLFLNVQKSIAYTAPSVYQEVKLDFASTSGGMKNENYDGVEKISVIPHSGRYEKEDSEVVSETAPEHFINDNWDSDASPSHLGTSDPNSELVLGKRISTIIGADGMLARWMMTHYVEVHSAIKQPAFYIDFSGESNAVSGEKHELVGKITFREAFNLYKEVSSCSSSLLRGGSSKKQTLFVQPYQYNLETASGTSLAGGLWHAAASYDVPRATAASKMEDSVFQAVKATRGLFAYLRKEESPLINSRMFREQESANVTQHIIEFDYGDRNVWMPHAVYDKHFRDVQLWTEDPEDSDGVDYNHSLSHWRASYEKWCVPEKLTPATKDAKFEFHFNTHVPNGGGKTMGLKRQTNSPSTCWKTCAIIMHGECI